MAKYVWKHFISTYMHPMNHSSNFLDSSLSKSAQNGVSTFVKIVDIRCIPLFARAGGKYYSVISGIQRISRK